MSSTRGEVESLLARLAGCPAGDFEAEDLDFRDTTRADPRTVARPVVEMTAGMVNGVGGTVLFEAADRVFGPNSAIREVSHKRNMNRFKLAVYESTNSKTSPAFGALSVAERPGRLLFMRVPPGTRRHTDSRGRGTGRVVTDCPPLSRKLRWGPVEAAEKDNLTARFVMSRIAQGILTLAMKSLRAAAEHVPQSFFVSAMTICTLRVRVVSNALRTRAAVLFAGSPVAEAGYRIA